MRHSVILETVKRIVILICFFLSCIRHHTWAQMIITTIAGNGTYSNSGRGDGGPASAGELYVPSAITMDHFGNMYIVDQDATRFRKIDPSGIITTFAGTGVFSLFYSGDGGPATLASVSEPTGVATDASGNIYITGDNINYHGIHKIDPSGIITSFTGSGGGFSGDGGPATAAALDANDLCTDGLGNVYVTCAGRIRKINSAGIISTIAGNGTTGYSGDGGPATAAEFNVPNGLVVDGSGNIYVADVFNNCVRKINASGIISTYAGTGTAAGYSGDGAAATLAQLNEPTYVATDGAGNVYISDVGRVRRVDASGIITTVAGNGSGVYSGDGGLATAAGIETAGIALDAKGNLYIADFYRIRRVNRNSIPYFTGGAKQSITVCENATDSINTLLAIVDTDLLQTETWSSIKAPLHGTLAATAVKPSTGDTVIPAGLSYTPTAGFTGTDSFKMGVSDGYAADTITDPCYGHCHIAGKGRHGCMHRADNDTERCLSRRHLEQRQHHSSISRQRQRGSERYRAGYGNDHLYQSFRVVRRQRR